MTGLAGVLVRGLHSHLIFDLRYSAVIGGLETPLFISFLLWATKRRKLALKNMAYCDHKYH